MKGFEKDVDMKEIIESLSETEQVGFENILNCIRIAFPKIDFYKAPYEGGRPGFSMGVKGLLKRIASTRWFTLFTGDEKNGACIYLVLPERTKVLEDGKKSLALKELASLLNISDQQPEKQYKQLREKTIFSLDGNVKLLNFVLKQMKSIDYIVKTMDGDGLLPDDYLVDSDPDVSKKHGKIPKGNIKPKYYNLKISVKDRFIRYVY